MVAQGTSLTATIEAVTRSIDSLDVSGPVQAEVFVVWLNGSRLELTGPCGAAPWIIELGSTEHPVEVVDRIVADALGTPRLVHSTSWRRDRDAVILSFVVVADTETVAGLESAPVERAALARSGPREAPRAVEHGQVLEHALRHLAWLAKEDPVVRGELSGGWQTVLARYVPEPFRSLD
jgi:hypothetical protein